MRAEALGVSEDLVVSFARRNGTPFDVALGRLLEKRSLSYKSTAVKALNFTDPSVRGVDLKRSIIEIEKFSKNIFSFKRDLMKIVGAKNEYELNKKVLDFEFKDPLIVICALGAQFDRLEKRYILNGISFSEAFARRTDFHRTLMSICHDLVQFGLSDRMLHNICEFSSELINPKFDLSNINKDNMIISNIKNNTNKQPDIQNPIALAADRFVYDGNDLMFNMNEELGCQIKLTTPIFNLYNKKRAHLDNSKETLKQQWIRGVRPKLCPNKSCWDFNFGIVGCPHAEPCKNKKEEHLLTHFCAFCGGDHPILLCQFLRCCMVLVRCNDSNWITRTYSTELKRIFWQNRARRNSRRGAFRGGRNNNNSFNNMSSTQPPTNNYNYGINNENFDFQNSFREYDTYNNDGYATQQQHQYHQNNGYNNRRGGRNRKRGNSHSNNGTGNGQYNSGAPHNGHA